MHRKALLFTLLMFWSHLSTAQDAKPALYHPEVDAMQQIEDLIGQAVNQNKQVFLQVGGNWCRWCLIFENFTKSTPAVDSIFQADYIVGHINFSKENKNLPAMERLGYPQRFGFPVFVILDEDGNLLHIQNTGYLESGEGYDAKKVTEFLLQWNVRAVSGEGL